MSQGALLETCELSLHFGGQQVLREVSVAVRPGEVVGLIGPNGSGKTSLLNCISGFYRPDRGAVLFQGRDITRMPPHHRAALGIGRTFQHPQLLPACSVLDNMLVGRHLHIQTTLVDDALHDSAHETAETVSRERVGEVLDFLGLRTLQHAAASTLSYAMQKLVEIGRAVVLEPALMLLDEPSAGMTREAKERVAWVLRQLRQAQHLGMVVIEHDLDFLGDLVDRVVVLDFGTVIAAGDVATVTQQQLVIEAYLGTRH